MRSLARTLLVVLGLLASLREAGSAACASTCVGRPFDVAAGVSCEAESACVPTSCCSPCGEPEVPCPLLEPTPQALIERPPAARTLPEPVAFAAFDLALVSDPADFDLHRVEARAGAPPGGGIRPRARPLWLLDRSLLI